MLEYTSPDPTIDAVWLSTARAVASDVPGLTLTICFPSSWARAIARRNTSGLRMASANIAMTFVSGCSTQYSSTDAMSMSHSLPVLANMPQWMPRLRRG